MPPAAPSPGPPPAARPALAEEAAAAGTTPIEDPVVEAPKKPRTGFAARLRPAGDDREAERGLRGLVGSGSSQVSVGAALRARDAARPTPEQIADAEQNLPIVRRNWAPREELPRNR